MRRALAIDRQRLAPGHEDLILPLNSLAMLEMARGHLTEAEVAAQRGACNAREHKHWMLGQVLTNVGDLHVRQHRPEQAGAALDEARTLLVAEYGDQLSGAAAWRLAILDSIAGSYEIERAASARGGEAPDVGLARPAGTLWRPQLLRRPVPGAPQSTLRNQAATPRSRNEYRSLLRSARAAD